MPTNKCAKIVSKLHDALYELNNKSRVSKGGDPLGAEWKPFQRAMTVLVAITLVVLMWFICWCFGTGN